MNPRTWAPHIHPRVRPAPPSMEALQKFAMQIGQRILDGSGEATVRFGVNLQWTSPDRTNGSSESKWTSLSMANPWGFGEELRNPVGHPVGHPVDIVPPSVRAFNSSVSASAAARCSAWRFQKGHRTKQGWHGISMFIKEELQKP